MDIRVERRRKLAAWPWIVGLLVLALAIWGLAELLGEDDGDEVVEQLEKQSP
jgi:type VI protein secretion system component VasF